MHQTLCQHYGSRNGCQWDARGLIKRTSVFSRTPRVTIEAESLINIPHAATVKNLRLQWTGHNREVRYEHNSIRIIIVNTSIRIQDWQHITNLANHSRFILNNEPILRWSFSSCIDLMLGTSTAAGETLASRLCELSSLGCGAGIPPEGILMIVCCCVSSIESWIAAAKSAAAMKTVRYNFSHSDPCVLHTLANHVPITAHTRRIFIKFRRPTLH